MSLAVSERAARVIEPQFAQSRHQRRISRQSSPSPIVATVGMAGTAAPKRVAIIGDVSRHRPAVPLT